MNYFYRKINLFFIEDFESLIKISLINFRFFGLKVFQTLVLIKFELIITKLFILTIFSDQFKIKNFKVTILSHLFEKLY